MIIWKLVVIILIILLFNTCRYFGYVDSELKLAWQEVNQDRDIFQNYEDMKEKAFAKFFENATIQEINKIDIQMQKEEQRILKTQSLIEKANPSEIKMLIK
jgi:hypothetical protein